MHFSLSKRVLCYSYGFVKTKFQFRNFLKMLYLSCRKCSEDSKTFHGLKIGLLLRELWAKMCFGTKS